MVGVCIESYPQIDFVMKHLSSFILTLLMIGLVGCNPLQSADDLSTATARASRNEQIATQMAAGGRATLEAEEAEATATAQSLADLLTAAKTWSILISENFDDNANAWPTGEDDSDLSFVRFQLDAQYRWEVTAKSGFIYWARPDSPAVSDFLLFVDGRQLSGAADGQYGLVIRQVDEYNYYIFRISSDGYFAFDRSTPEGWETIIDWTGSEAIHPNQVNHLGVIAQQARFLFFVNEQFIGEAYDDHLSEGQCGVVIGLFDAEDEAVFEFDNFELRTP